MKPFFLVLLAIAAQATLAQTPYSSDLADYSNTLRALLAKAERTSAANKPGRLAIQTESFELQKRLAEATDQSARANLALVQSGEPNDKNLLLVSASADTLLLAKKFLDYYLYTNDKFFLTQANEVAALGKTLRAAIK